MLDRFIYGENARRKGIYREALDLTRKGWYVMAGYIPGFHNPPEIEGHIPDLYAVRDNRTIIIDFITDGNERREACEAHSRYALHDDNTEYHCWALDSAGCSSEAYA